jgi:hypothetical protein
MTALKETRLGPVNPNSMAHRNAGASLSEVSSLFPVANLLALDVALPLTPTLSLGEREP